MLEFRLTPRTRRILRSSDHAAYSLIPYRRLGTDRLSRNVGKVLALCAA